MLRTSQKKFASAQIGDTVRRQGPDVNCSRADNRNVLVVVVEKEDSDFYKLANENAARSSPYVDSITQFASTPAPLKYCEIFSSREKPNGWKLETHLRTGTFCEIRREDATVPTSRQWKRSPF
ncbi:hypothetical protein TNCV_3283551 [Trichonephila clavipes]|nr:hypothetical protein TNCV_3283551 [Trichonephila clavipes]